MQTLYLTYTDFWEIEMAQIDSSDCDVDCASCYEELGSLVDFIADGQGTANDYYFRQEDCDRICNGDEFSPCDAAFNMMLIDMNPGGQYASYLNPQTGEIDASFSPLSIFNVDHHLPVSNASIYAPKFIDAYGVINNYYMDEKNIIFYKNSNLFFESKKNERIILMTTRASISYTKFKFEVNDTILFGRESAGVPDSIHNIIKDRLKIPMKENKRSLNIASSVAIVLAESLKQTGQI